MATGLFNWSQTAASNANATYTWAEGMAPSSVNDSARGIMSDVAKWRDDISGAIVTGGLSTAYTVTSYSVFTSLALMNGQMIAFTPHTTNGATVTLNVDGLGAKPLRPAPSTELQSGVLIQGTPYAAVYNNSDQVFYLFGVGTAPAIPLGSSIDYWGTTAPSSHFVLAYGQAISRTTYSTLFSLFSTTYGTGDGSTTFNIPDLRGRVVAGADNMGGSAAGRLTDAVAGIDILGDAGGAQSVTLSTTEIPSHTHSNTLNDPGHAHLYPVGASGGAPTNGNPPQGQSGGTAFTNTGISSTTGITISNAAAGGGGAHNNVQPTIVANKLIRII